MNNLITHQLTFKGVDMLFTKLSYNRFELSDKTIVPNSLLRQACKDKQVVLKLKIKTRLPLKKFRQSQNDISTLYSQMQLLYNCND